MALLMEFGAEPTTESERADLDAIDALKESAAREYKEQGNQLLKARRYHDAIHCYSKAISQLQSLTAHSDTYLLFSNRAHAHLLLANYRHALSDAQHAINLYPSNIKAYYRAAKAAISLNSLSDAASFCQRGLEQDPSNEDFKKLLLQIDAQTKAQDRLRARASQAVSAAKDLAAAIEMRGLKLGKASYRELTGPKKPKLDEHGVLHWPVLFLYPEVMSSDLIEDFQETDTFSAHLDVMFSESSPLSWDNDHAYTREAVELYYQGDIGMLMSKNEVLKYLLEGTVNLEALADSLLEGEDREQSTSNTALPASELSGKFIEVKEGNNLKEVLQHKDYIIPAIPVFLVVSNKSAFYDDFRAGKWSLP